jgi:hypothetical protein
MKRNVCGIERRIRAIVGAILATFYIMGIAEGVWGIVTTIAGCVLLLTAFSSYCPINALLGINRCQKKETEKQELPIGVNQMYQNPQANDGYVSKRPDTL